MIFLKSGIAFADECKKISKEETYNFSDIVFLGHVFEVGDSTYRIKVIELFKGKQTLNDTLVGIISRDVITPGVGSIWLIYAQGLDDNRFIADVCSGSKSMNWPHGTNDITFPTPPPSEVYKNPSQLFLLKQIIIDKALNEFYYDVASLRARKAQEENKLIKEERNRLTQQYGILAKELAFMKWLLVVLIVISIGLMIINFKKR